MEPEECNVRIAVLSSDVNLEPLRPFHTTPKLAYSSKEIVKLIGRTKDEIQAGLDHIVTIGVIKRTGELESFCLDEDKGLGHRNASRDFSLPVEGRKLGTSELLRKILLTELILGIRNTPGLIPSKRKFG